MVSSLKFLRQGYTRILGAQLKVHIPSYVEAVMEDPFFLPSKA